MASKRNLRRKACAGKVMYTTQEEAEPVAKRLHLHTYRCAHCSGFHNGHPPRRVKVGLAAKRRNDEFTGRLALPEDA